VRTGALEFEAVTLALSRLQVAEDAIQISLSSGHLGAEVLAEMHDAALGLIWATGTTDLVSALAALHITD
jgi:hypothetical protein